VRILDTQGEVGAHFRTFAATDAFGSNGNANGTGDIAFQYPGDGSVNMFVLGTNNGIIAYKITTPMAVNGRFHEKYTMMAESQNNNRGFGENIYVKRLAYTIANDKLYLALESRLDKTNDNGIVVFLNVNKLAGQGAPAGTALGAVTGLGHVLGNTANPNFKNDFETHFAFVINPGGADSMVYVDGAKYTTSTKIGQYLGKAKQDGSGAFGPEVAGVFTANSINFAFDSAYGGGRGWEIAIPLSEIGNPTAVNQISAFAAVVSSTAYFSNVTVPGNAGTSNPGFNPNFQTMSGGPFHSVGVPVPVELTSFTYQVIGLQIQLQWKTASEKNNRGFEIQRSFDGSSFERIGFIPGSGTTTEQIAYSFVDKPALNETIYYRLKQIDFDGSTNYSNVISVDFNSSPSVFALEQNYPNPFNPSTMIRFSVNKNLPTTLKIYDVLGVEVASLFDGIAKAGESYQLQFNAVNVPSGVYFYSLRQADNTITRRMLLLK
jgi:hypothetical protein